MASCGTTTTSHATPIASAPGVTTSSVLFASEVNTATPSHRYAIDEVAGMRAVLRLFDRHHGVFGRQLSLVVKDDAGQSAIAADETSYLGNTVGAFALIGDSPSTVAPAVSAQASSAGGILQLFPVGAATGPNTVNTAPSVTTVALDLGAALRSLDLANGTIGVLASGTVPKIATDLGVTTTPVQLTYTSSGQLQGASQLTSRVPDLIVSFAPRVVTAKLLTELGRLNEAPTVIAVSDTVSRATLRAEAPTFHGTLLRFGTWVPLGALNRAWSRYLGAVDQFLAPKVPMNSATLDGIYAATMSVELLRSVGINPSRRAILTNLARDRFVPLAPAIGPWTATSGFQGGVLTGTAHPWYVSGFKVNATPPHLPAPPAL
ncbi:ABC transporter substrate-binding protein [Ferrimicrobium sp.]|nr:ABC transporter substrate-binding protein [Ferrimicrobium sp.]